MWVSNIKLETKLIKKIKKNIRKKIVSHKKQNKKKIEIFLFLKNEKKWKKQCGETRYFFPRKSKIGKTEKSKFLNIFVPFVCTLKIFWETTLWCYAVFQKNFRDVSIPFGYLKNSPKIFFSEKKAIPQKFRGEIKKKSKNLADRPKSAKYFLGIKTYVLGGYSVSISFNSYNNWVLQSLLSSGGLFWTAR